MVNRKLLIIMYIVHNLNDAVKVKKYFEKFAVVKLLSTNNTVTFKKKKTIWDIREREIRERERSRNEQRKLTIIGITIIVNVKKIQIIFCAREYDSYEYIIFFLKKMYQ